MVSESFRPDGIPTEVLKGIAQLIPLLLLNIYNKHLLEGIFRKDRHLVLNKHKGFPETPSEHLPIYMLNTTGNLLE